MRCRFLSVPAPLGVVATSHVQERATSDSSRPTIWLVGNALHSPGGSTLLACTSYNTFLAQHTHSSIHHVLAVPALSCNSSQQPEKRYTKGTQWPAVLRPQPTNWLLTAYCPSLPSYHQHTTVARSIALISWQHPYALSYPMQHTHCAHAR